MRKFVLIAMAFMASLTSFAQNGGQSPENSDLKISSSGLNTSGQIRIFVFNKQSCEVNIQVTQVGKNGKDTVIHLTGGASMEIDFTPSGGTAKIQAKALTNCSGTSKADGVVELVVNVANLPVKWAQTPTAKFNPKTRVLTVTFSIADATNVKEFRVQGDFGNQYYRNIGVPVPLDQVQPNKPYTVNIKL